MRTEYDLRAAIDELAQDAPDVEHVLPAVHPRRRHRLLAPIAVAAAVLAVAGGVAVATAGRGSPPGPAAADESLASVAHPCATYGRPELRTFSIGHVEGFTDEQDTPSIVQGCAGYTSRDIYSADGKDVGSVTIYRPGVFDTNLLTRARAVRGSGVDGYSIPPTVPTVRDVDSKLGVPVGCPAVYADPGAAHVATTCPTEPTLAWQYAPGAWATVASNGAPLPTAKQFEIAAAVDTKHFAPVRVPFEFGSLPHNVRVTNVYSDISASGKPVAVTVGFGITGRSGCPSDAVCEQVGEVSLTPPHGALPHEGEPVPINGETAYLIYQGEARPDIPLTFQTGTWNVLVAQASDRQLPNSDLIAIARGLRYASSTTDRSTWFPAP